QSPMGGVTVTVAGSSVQTQTDDGGTYQLATTNVQTIVFRYLGYEQQEVSIAGLSPGADGVYVVDVTMQLSAEAELDEVVVVGYGTQKRSDITGAVASVSKERLSKLPVNNVMQAIQGAVANVTV